jgi:hypothetical protein
VVFASGFFQERRNIMADLGRRQRGVIDLVGPVSMHKRSYRGIRIPRTVFARVIDELTIKYQERFSGRNQRFWGFSASGRR